MRRQKDQQRFSPHVLRSLCPPTTTSLQLRLALWTLQSTLSEPKCSEVLQSASPVDRRCCFWLHCRVDSFVIGESVEIVLFFD